MVPRAGGPRTTAAVIFFYKRRNQLVKTVEFEMVRKSEQPRQFIKTQFKFRKLITQLGWLSSVAVRLMSEARIKLVGTAREGFF